MVALSVSCNMKVTPEFLVEQFKEESQAPGVFVAVVQGNKVLYEKAFGFADKERRHRMDANTCMELGSISKQFTAQVIYDLERTGALRLSDTISKYFPGAPSPWSKITIRHLLKHSSGIQNYLLDPRFYAASLFTGQYDTLAKKFFKNLSVDSMVKMFYTLPIEFDPGASWSYSNTGYILLGKIAERVTGKPYQDIVRERLLMPLGMERTMPTEQAHEERCRATGNLVVNDELQPATMLPWKYAFSAGAWSTTGADMIKFIKAIHDHQLPIDKSKHEWRGIAPDEMPFTYEVASFHTNFRGQKIIAHNGGTPGFSSSWIYVPGKDLSIIVLCNRQDYAGIDLLAADLLSIFDHSLFYRQEEIRGKEEDYYAQRVLEIVHAIENDKAYPLVISKPLKIFLETENGKGLWKWYLHRGVPTKLYCVGKDTTSTGTTYRFWASGPNKAEYKFVIDTNLKNEIVQLRWW